MDENKGSNRNCITPYCRIEFFRSSMRACVTSAWFQCFPKLSVPNYEIGENCSGNITRVNILEADSGEFQDQWRLFPQVCGRGTARGLVNLLALFPFDTLLMLS